jgi:hypothetical protein
VFDDSKKDLNKRKHSEGVKDSEEDSDDDVWDNMGIVQDNALSKKTKSE